jgi:hypothetical protein
LRQLDGVLVWVDPISYGEDRSILDAMLRDVAANGVWVSANPDLILKMGTKEVLYRTRTIGWGRDTDLYPTADEFRERFPLRLVTGTRVLKQYRGNGGQGVWKVELLDREPDVPYPAAEMPDRNARLRVLEAQRNSLEQETSLSEFLDRCATYFANSGRLIDQAFQERLPEGMIRCYLSQDRVIGFTHQLIRGLMPAPANSDPEQLPQPGPRIMQPPTASGFELLRQKVESEWVPAMSQILDLDRIALPVLWDADFLFGPRTVSGEDSYVLCEINVSSVTPYPEFAADQIAESAIACVRD